MEYRTPKIFLISKTQDVMEGVHGMLEALGVPDWKTDAGSGAEALIEIAGRLCYKAFGTGLNPNITKVREGNKDYIGNLLKQKHGSVLEHTYVGFGLIDVSRILTHEAVRHRAGAAYSQESLRFVRFDNVGLYMPKVFEPEALEAFYEYDETPGGMVKSDWAIATADRIEGQVRYAVTAAERAIATITHFLVLNNPKMPFVLKKAATSALRRIAPSGMLTNIIMTCNHRAWRHIVEARTSPGAEEEIDHVMREVGRLLKANYPNIYQDMEITDQGCIFANTKV